VRTTNRPVLGAGNPPLTQRALDVDRTVGLLLPCNVVVRAEDGGSVVEVLDPRVSRGRGRATAVRGCGPGRREGLVECRLHCWGCRKRRSGRGAEKAVRIAVIGTGKMGRGFATGLSSRHEVYLGSRDPGRAGKVVRSTGAAGAMSPGEAAVGADVVILAIPWQAMEEALAGLGDLDGTVVVDVSVPYGKELEALGRRSSGEVVQKRLPRSRVVKGWNHVYAHYLTAPEVDGIASSVLLAGDDPEAKRIVCALAREMGFHPVDVGPLRASFHLDRLVSMTLFVKLGPFRVLSAPH
jgi:predicted dinucleotide-binding enzyme